MTLRPEEWYKTLDPGIRFAVRVLHARGIETGQSCEGGNGHSYVRPTIELQAGCGSDVQGFAALAALETFGLEVSEISLVWPIDRGMPYEKNWRIELRRAWPERAQDKPDFILREEHRP